MLDFDVDAGVEETDILCALIHTQSCQLGLCMAYAYTVKVCTVAEKASETEGPYIRIFA